MTTLLAYALQLQQLEVEPEGLRHYRLPAIDRAGSEPCLGPTSFPPRDSG